MHAATASTDRPTPLKRGCGRQVSMGVGGSSSPVAFPSALAQSELCMIELYISSAGTRRSVEPVRARARKLAADVLI